jgi:hypothetical protein
MLCGGKAAKKPSQFTGGAINQFKVTGTARSKDPRKSVQFVPEGADGSLVYILAVVLARSPTLNL